MSIIYMYFIYIHLFSGEKADLYDKTNPDWAPSLKMRTVKKKTSKTISAKRRYKRSKRRDGKKIKLKTAEPLLDLRATADSNTDFDETFCFNGNLEPAGETAGDKLLYHTSVHLHLSDVVRFELINISNMTSE